MFLFYNLLSRLPHYGWKLEIYSLALRLDRIGKVNSKGMQRKDEERDEKRRVGRRAEQNEGRLGEQPERWG